MPGATSRDPTLWPNPDDFTPSRFDGLTDDDLQWKFLPLGGGPITGHKCLGSNLAPLLSKVLAIYLYKDFTWTVKDPNQGFDMKIPAPPPADGLQVTDFHHL